MICQQNPTVSSQMSNAVSTSSILTSQSQPVFYLAPTNENATAPRTILRFAQPNAGAATPSSSAKNVPTPWSVPNIAPASMSHHCSFGQFKPYSSNAVESTNASERSFHMKVAADISKIYDILATQGTQIDYIAKAVGAHVENGSQKRELLPKPSSVNNEEDLKALEHNLQNPTLKKKFVRLLISQCL